MTKTTGVRFDAEAQCPQFLTAFERLFPSAEIREFMHRAIGAGLVGRQREAFMVIVEGVGGDGKSTLFNAVIHALGGMTETSYADASSPTLVIKTRFGDERNFQLADVRGRRLLVVGEPDDGAYLNVGAIKRLTGGDVIKADRKGENQISFRPYCTLFLPCNRAPRVTAADFGTWRRLLLVRTTGSHVQEGTVDVEMPEKLEAEAEGVLAWCVRGAVSYLASGLGTPPLVQHWSGEYRQEQDDVMEFRRDCLVAADGGKEATVQQVYEAYTVWAGEAHAVVLSRKALVSRLRTALAAERRVKPEDTTRLYEGRTLWRDVAVRNRL